MLTENIVNVKDDAFQAKLKDQIKVGSMYEHYKGKRYRVLMLARSSEDTTFQVIYEALYTDKDFGANSMWVRPLSEFLGYITIDDKIVPRFKEVKV